MNLQTLMNQLQGATNPLQMMMGMLNPNQKQMINLFQGKTSQQQAEEIARKCNEMGITKEQLQQVVQMLGKR